MEITYAHKHNRIGTYLSIDTVGNGTSRLHVGLVINQPGNAVGIVNVVEKRGGIVKSQEEHIEGIALKFFSGVALVRGVDPEGVVRSADDHIVGQIAFVAGSEHRGYYQACQRRKSNE